MPILNTVARTIAKPLPRFLSPGAHAVADYLTISSFLAMGASFWRQSKRAALAAWICGGSELAVSLLTDYPGGVKKVISFPVHGELDQGLAAITALMPKFMGVHDAGHKVLFLLQGAGITTVTELTNFGEPRRRSEKKSSRGLFRRAA